VESQYGPEALDCWGLFPPTEKKTKNIRCRYQDGSTPNTTFMELYLACKRNFIKLFNNF
jgi:hypothetical protein